MSFSGQGRIKRRRHGRSNKGYCQYRLLRTVLSYATIYIKSKA